MAIAVETSEVLIKPAVWSDAQIHKLITLRDN